MKSFSFRYLLAACMLLLLVSCSEKQKSLHGNIASFDELVSKVECYSLNEKNNEQSLFYSYHVNYGLTGRIESFDLIDYLGLEGRMKYQYEDDVLSVQYRYKPGVPFYEGYASVIDGKVAESSTYGGEYGVSYFYDEVNHLDRIVNIDGEELKYHWKNNHLNSIYFYPEGVSGFEESAMESSADVSVSDTAAVSAKGRRKEFIPDPGFRFELDMKYKKVSTRNLNLDVAQLFLIDMVMNCGSGIGFSDTLMELCGYVGTRCPLLPDTAQLTDTKDGSRSSYKFMYGMDGSTVEDIVISRNGEKIFRIELSYIKNPLRYS